MMRLPDLPQSTGLSGCDAGVGVAVGAGAGTEATVEFETVSDSYVLLLYA